MIQTMKKGNSMRHQKQDAFTLVELLVVIAIIAMLVTALMPAIQAARSTARRTQCKGNMTQLVMAMQNYEMAFTHYPSGVLDESGPIQSEAKGQHHSFLIAMLPYLDESTIHRNIDQTKSVYSDENARVRQMTIPTLQCPSDASSGAEPSSSYAGCHHDVEAPIDADNHGMLFLNSQVTIEDVRDGLSQTLLLGEKTFKMNGLGWMSGTRATLRNTGTPINVSVWKPLMRKASRPKKPVQRVDKRDAEDEEAKEKAAAAAKPTQPVSSVGGFGSSHGAGAHMAFVDGRVQFLPVTISGQVLQQLGHRDDGKLLDPAEYRD